MSTSFYERRVLATTRRLRGLVASRRQGDEGATLILALILMLVGGLIVGGLAIEESNDLGNSTTFAKVRSMQYAARSSANLAIENIRYSPLIASGATPYTLDASPPAPCWASSSGISEVANIDGESMESWCSTAWAPTSSHTRTVTISTCVVGTTASQCASNPYLQVVVTFDDYPPGVSPPSSNPCQSPPVGDCGSSMLLDSWLWLPKVPTVTTIAPTSGNAAGGATLTLTGTGFVTGTTVQFVECTVGSGGCVPSGNNVVLQATNVTVNSPTSITAQVPAAVQGTNYDVDATTANGSSAFNSNTLFTYTYAGPTISSVSPTTDLSSAGGTRLTITGTGFTSNTKVTLIPEAGGSSYTAQYITVTSPTTLTAVSPAVTELGSYYVTVTTTAGATPENSADAYTYVYVVPTVSMVSPNSGPKAGGTALTITGTGFLSGATVTFYQTSSGCQSGFGTAATGVTVVNATTITANSPKVFSDAQYYVDVTTTGGGSTYSANCYPIFTYSG